MITCERIDSTTDTESYMDEISHKVPNLECFLHSVSSMEMSKHFSGYSTSSVQNLIGNLLDKEKKLNYRELKVQDSRIN